MSEGKTIVLPVKIAKKISISTCWCRVGKLTKRATHLAGWNPGQGFVTVWLDLSAKTS